MVRSSGAWAALGMRLLAMVLVVGSLWMGYKSWQEHERNAKIQAEIDILAKEAEKIRRENESLTQKIEYLASPDFQEQEAKKKLGLRRQEESLALVHAVPSIAEAPESSQSEMTFGTQADIPVPNYRKWWQLFFE